MSELRRLEQSLRCYEDVESETTGLTSTPESPLKKAVATDTDDLGAEMMTQPRAEVKEEGKAEQALLPADVLVEQTVEREEAKTPPWEDLLQAESEPREEPKPKTPPSQDLFDLDEAKPREPKTPEPCVAQDPLEEQSVEVKDDAEPAEPSGSVDGLAEGIELRSPEPEVLAEARSPAVKEAPELNAEPKAKAKPRAKSKAEPKRVRIRSTSANRMATRLHEPISARLRESRGLEIADVARLVASPEIGRSQKGFGPRTTYLPSLFGTSWASHMAFWGSPHSEAPSEAASRTSSPPRQPQRLPARRPQHSAGEMTACACWGAHDGSCMRLFAQDRTREPCDPISALQRVLSHVYNLRGEEWQKDVCNIITIYDYIWSRPPAGYPPHGMVPPGPGPGTLGPSMRLCKTTSHPSSFSIHT